MGKIYKYCIALLTILSLSACTKEIESAKEETTKPEDVKLVSLDIKAGGESFSDTKAIVQNGGNQIFWENTDKLGVFDGTAKREFVTTTADGTSSRTMFSGEVAENAESLIAVYPFEAGVSCSGETVTARIPKEQIVQKGKNIAQDAIVSVGKIISGKLDLKTTVAVVKVNIKRPDVKAIVIEGTNIAGTAEFSASDGSLSKVVTGENKVSLKYSEGLFAAGDYYITLMPGKTNKGDFKVYIERENFKSETLSSKKELTLIRNSSLDFSALESAISYKYVISTAEELVNWGKIAEFCNNSDTVELAADIDLKQAEWTPFEFKGTFDGKNHKIYNFKVSTTDSYAAFFQTLSGHLKNTVFGSSDGNSYDGFSTFELGYTKDNKTWMYVGLVGKILEKGSITNVKNFAKVKVLQSNITKFRLGGIAGNWASEGSLEMCRNHGEIIVEDCAQGVKDTQPEFNVIGGLVGWADKAPQRFNGCINAGNIINHCKFVKHFGGVFGCSGNNKVSLESCDNSGDINDDAEHTSDLWLGGIMGKFNDGGKLKYCKNNGKINFTGKASRLNIGGVLAYTTKSDPSVLNCENEGDIKVNASADNDVNIGGVVAYMKGKDKNNVAIIKDCKNFALVEVYGGTNGKTHVGGVCGKSDQHSKLSDSIVNEGKILIHDSGRIFQAGGIAGYSYHSPDEIFSDGSESYNKGDIEAIGLVREEGETHHIGGALGYCTAEYRRIKVSARIIVKAAGGASVSAGLAVGQSGKKTGDYKFHQGSFKGSISATVESGGDNSNVHAGILYGSFKEASTPETRKLQFGWDETLLLDPTITVNGIQLTESTLDDLLIGNPNGTPARFEANPKKPHDTHRIQSWNL